MKYARYIPDQAEWTKGNATMTGNRGLLKAGHVYEVLSKADVPYVKDHNGHSVFLDKEPRLIDAMKGVGGVQPGDVMRNINRPSIFQHVRGVDKATGQFLSSNGEWYLPVEYNIEMRRKGWRLKGSAENGR